MRLQLLLLAPLALLLSCTGSLKGDCSVDPAGCEPAVDRVVAGTQNLLRELCQESLKSGGQLSEEPLYRAFFVVSGHLEMALSEHREALFQQLWDDFTGHHNLIRRANNMTPAGISFSTELQNLFRLYVSLQPEEAVRDGEWVDEAQSSLGGKQGAYRSLNAGSTLGVIARLLVDNPQYSQHQVARRVGEEMVKLRAHRGSSVDDLLLAYMIERYPYAFFWEVVKERGWHRDKYGQAVSPTDILGAKTSPSLACNNYAASVVSEPIPWARLGMEHYSGIGYVNWFHEPVAKFYFNHPMVVLVPIVGWAFSAADNLLTAIEGKNAQGDDIGASGQVAAALWFVFEVSLSAYGGVTGISAIKSLSPAVAARLKGISQGVMKQIKALPRTLAGLKELRRILLRSMSANAPLGAQSIVVDTQIALSVSRKAAGETLSASERAAVSKLEQLAGGAAEKLDLRVARTTIEETLTHETKLTGFGVSVERSSSEWKELYQKLESLRVGANKGVADRTILADTFLADTHSGVRPTFLTQDKKILNPLYREAVGLSEEQFGKLGKTVAELVPDGFEVTINGLKIKVLPVPPT